MGAAMRLGAVYSGRTAPLLKQIRLRTTKSKLVLDVVPGCEDMISATVQKRLSQLASIMDLNPEVSVLESASS
jgi:exopolyphosphatase/guanosine-5'-triphosphate,3'-diphosphate pyrophosphatase